MKASSEYEVTVDAVGKGSAEITYQIELTNKSVDYFIRDYSIITQHKDMTKLKVYENNKPINFKKEEVGSFVRVKAILAKQLANRGERTNIKVRYMTDKIVKDSGYLKTIFIPPVQTEEKLKVAKFRIILTKNKNKISYNSVKRSKVLKSGGKVLVKYKQKDAPQGALFNVGNMQQFEFEYSYDLSNDEEDPKRFSMTLPPGGTGQKVFFTGSQPQVEKVWVDNSNNHLAEYSLSRGGSGQVKISGYVQNSAVTEEKLTIDDVEMYKAPTPIWDTSSEKIQEETDKLDSTALDDYSKGKKIYNYVIKKFNHSPNIENERKPFSQLLSQKRLACSQFADGFVTLARSKGLAAKVHVGYIFLQNDIDSFHHWASFYDRQEKKWVEVDPCIEAWLGYSGFENVGLNRFTLAFWGIEDANPPVISPFEKYQSEDYENIRIVPLLYDFSNNMENIDFSYSVGKVDGLYQFFPITFHVRNNSQRVFTFDNVLVDGRKVPFFKEHENEKFQEGVFPSQHKNISVLVGSKKHVSAERIGNHRLYVSGLYGDKFFEKKEQFEVDYHFSMHQILLWFIAGIISIQILFVWGQVGSKLLKGISLSDPRSITRSLSFLKLKKKISDVRKRIGELRHKDTEK